jgi:hypothetical protein
VVAGSVPAGVYDAVLEEDDGRLQRLNLIPFHFASLFVAPVGRDVERVRVMATDADGNTSEAGKRSLRLKARRDRPFG